MHFRSGAPLFVILSVGLCMFLFLFFSLVLKKKLRSIKLTFFLHVPLLIFFHTAFICQTRYSSPKGGGGGRQLHTPHPSMIDYLRGHIVWSAAEGVGRLVEVQLQLAHPEVHNPGPQSRYYHLRTVRRQLANS